MANELQRKMTEYYDRGTALVMDYRNYMEKQVEVGANITNSLDKMQGSIAQMQTGIQTSINNQTLAVVASQKALANNFSQGFNQINNTLDMGFSGVSNQLGRMTASFSMGLARIENTLDRMSDIMNNPLLTQSRELYRRATERSRKGQFEEALEDTQAALEKDKTDYAAWFLQGKIYSFGASKYSNVIDLDKSIEALTKAAKYNEPNIADTYGARNRSAEIYFYLGLAQYSKSNDLLRENKNAESSEMIKKARGSFAQSYLYSNNMLESLFNIARCNVVQGETDNVIEDLKTLVLCDRNYCIKVYADNDFSSIWEQFTILIDELKNEAFIPAKDDYDHINTMLAELKSLDGYVSESIPSSFTKELPYFDILDYAKDFIRISPIVYDALSNAKRAAAAEARAKTKAEAEEKAAKAEIQKKDEEKHRYKKVKIVIRYFYGGLALYLLGCYMFLDNAFFSDKPWYYAPLIFYIPFTIVMILIAVTLRKNNIVNPNYDEYDSYSYNTLGTGFIYTIIAIIIAANKVDSIFLCCAAFCAAALIGYFMGGLFYWGIVKKI